jgi:antitoxin component YwqK of YwqJK toxin-antitoxin module
MLKAYMRNKVTYLLIAAMASISCNQKLFMERVDVSLLEKMETGEVKLNQYQKIEPRNSWDSGKIFILSEKEGTALSTTTLHRKEGKVVSVEKRTVTGDTVKYYSFFPNGNLKERQFMLLTPVSTTPERKIFFDNIKIGTHYVFAEKGKPIASTNYDQIFSYSLSKLLDYCKQQYSDSMITINQWYYDNDKVLPPSLSNYRFIKIKHPYWTVTVNMGMTDRTLKSEVYLIDGKTGALLNHTPFNVRGGMGAWKKSK